MIRFFARHGLRQFSRRYNYDTAYLEHLLDTNLWAFLKFSAVKLVSGHHSGIPPSPWFAASIRAAMFEDCGPCAQLVCDMALEAGVERDVVQNVISADLQQLPGDIALVVSFTEMVLARDMRADELREQIKQRWGEDGLISLAFTISSTRVYPSLKYVLGHGHACSRLQIKEHYVIPQKLSARGMT